MSTTIIETPAGVAPGRIVGHVRVPPALPQVSVREFNRDPLDRSDPLEGAGTNIESFGVSVSYPVARSKHPAVLGELFETVCGRLVGNSIPGATVRLIDFKDAATPSEPPRRYVMMEKETPRWTHMSLFATFRSYGDFLYVSVDAFVLPPLNLIRVWRAILISLALVVGSLATIKVVGTLLLTIPWLMWHFRDVLGSLRHGDDLEMALRRRYYTLNDMGTFNLDDMLVYFKSTVLLAIEGIAEVFEAHDIPVDVLNQVKQTINHTTNVVNGGGGVMNLAGSVIGGVSNVVSGARA